ncbi:hypothetical protein CHUAL_006052 [Chamberlinius hualienensis]
MDHSHHHATTEAESHVGHDMDDMGNSTMMAMYFHTGFKETILFQGWATTSVGGMVGSCIGVFFIAILYEALKYYREYLFKQTFASVSYSSVGGGPTNDAAKLHRSVSKRIMSPGHFAQTGLHVLQVTISYFLMLVFMTYNVWLCISVVIGAGVGFFLFGWKKTIVVDITEHCH